jgi:predicted PurR-regulated permease PerM
VTPNVQSARAWPWLLLSVVLLALLWHLRHAAILIFGAVLVGATLRALSDPLVARFRLSPRASTTIVLAAMAVAIGAAGWWIGNPLASQLASLGSELPRAWTGVQAWLARSTVGSWLLDSLNQLGDAALPWAGLASLAGTTVEALSAVVLILLMGVYLAFDASLYKRGFVRLFPVGFRPRLDDALKDAGRSLRRWLIGQALTMLAVGLLSAAGLFALGVPLALALGVIAGLLEFVPFFGPIASGLLAVLVAFAQDPTTALEVALLFFAIQQLEGNLLVPLVQRWAVRLPPLLGIAGIVVFGALFGVAGIVFGTPLVVVGMVLVRRLYVEQALEGASSSAG